jgi:hypothetical protein
LLFTLADMTLLQVALKISDLGHLASSHHVHLRWVANLEEEFFSQVSPMYWRVHANAMHVVQCSACRAVQCRVHEVQCSIIPLWRGWRGS